MDHRTYGYARVSTREQNEDRQIAVLLHYGVPEGNIIIDKCSGKDTEREGYRYLIPFPFQNHEKFMILIAATGGVWECMRRISCRGTA